MITKERFKALLKHLHFKEKTKNVFTKTINESVLEVDFNQGKIIYPENGGKGLQVNQRQTCHLSANENFVVFECVHRLLEKGYKPEHLELEPQWQLGRGASGGRADILIKDRRVSHC